MLPPLTAPLSTPTPWLHCSDISTALLGYRGVEERRMGGGAGIWSLGYSQGNCSFAVADIESGHVSAYDQILSPAP